MLSQANKICTSIFILFFIVLPVNTLAQNDIPPSSAGGKSLDLRGGRQCYYYAEDIDNCFDDELLKNGMTIEFWFCPARPVEKGEGWNMVAKPPIYLIAVAYWGTKDQAWMSLRCASAGGWASSWFYDLLSDKKYVPKWYHVAVQLISSDEGQFFESIFIDGVSRQKSGGCCNITDNDEPLYIGGLPEGSEISVFVVGDYIRSNVTTFDGLIDELRISNIQRYGQKFPRDKIDIQNRFEPDENTVALWHFDERSEDLSYKDDSGNGHTLFAAGQFTAIHENKIPYLWGIMKRR